MVQKTVIDVKYETWILVENRIWSPRKGQDRRAQRWEAGWRKAAAENHAAIGRHALRRTEYTRVQKLYSKNRADCARKVLAGHQTALPLRSGTVLGRGFWVGLQGGRQGG